VGFVGLAQEDFWPKGSFFFIVLIGPLIFAWVLYRLILLSFNLALTDRKIKLKLAELFVFFPALAWAPVEIYATTRWWRDKTNLKVVWITWISVLLISLAFGFSVS
jgi:hypothetical protein